jgi:hypothetical protein
MPRGVYPRTAAQIEAAKANFAKGRTPEARAKANAKIRVLCKTPEFSANVSKGTRAAMHRTDIRSRHLSGLVDARERFGLNFRGGNGQSPTPIVELFNSTFAPLGFIREFVVPTKGHTTDHKPPSGYKIDFAHPLSKIAVELDGPCHRPLKRREQDKRKTEVLSSLGWTVFRVPHS